MHVLVLNALYPPNVLGGAEISTSTLVEGLRARDHRVSVVSISPDGREYSESGPGWSRHFLRPVNIENPYRRKHRNPILSRAWLAAIHTIDSYNPWMGRRLAAIFGEEAPDVVHSNNLFGLSVAVWQSAKRNRLPVVHSIRDHYLLCAFSHRYRGNKRCDQRCAQCLAWSAPRKMASGKVDVAIGISRAILESHVQAGYFENADKRVIHNAVRGCRNPPATGVHAPVTLGYLGQVAPIKGVDLLLEAVQQMDAGAVRLLVAGTGNAGYVQQLKERFRLPNVEWIGHVDPEELFDRIDLLVVPSLWDEPAGRVVPEAFCHGRPVLVSNRGGLPEMLGTQGAGWSFDPDDGPAELAARIEHLVRIPSLLVEAGRRAADCAKRFEVDVMVDCYLDAYAAAIRRAKAGATHAA